MSVGKTKCMVFCRGYCPNITFHYLGEPIETCNSFTYLGVVFSTRLSAIKHVNHVVSKCNAKIGYLFSRLPLREIPLAVALDVFNTYVLPVIHYCLPIWFPSLCESSKSKLNAVYTKYLKRYLGVPYITNNAIVHFLTGTEPITSVVGRQFMNLRFPSALDGVKITPPALDGKLELCSTISKIPTYFWASEILDGLPVLPTSRRALLYDIIDLHHSHICGRREFHLNPHDGDVTCSCRFCGGVADRYHFRECVELAHMTPCYRLRRIFR